MTEEEKKEHKRGKPVYIMIPRKLIIAWITSTVVLFIMNLASFQYTNYVERKGNSLLCGIVVLFDDSYTRVPPPPGRGQILAREFHRIRVGYKCK